MCLVLYYSLTLLQMYKCRLKQIAMALSILKFDTRYQKTLTNARVAVFAGLNQVSASLDRFKPRVWQKQVFAGRNPTLITEQCA